MKFLNIPVLAIKKVVRYIMGSHNARNTILWVPELFIILEHSITFCSYLLWVQEGGRRARIVKRVGKIYGCSRD
jgi:hypothetical protein